MSEKTLERVENGTAVRDATYKRIAEALGLEMAVVAFIPTSASEMPSEGWLPMKMKMGFVSVDSDNDLMFSKYEAGGQCYVVAIHTMKTIMDVDVWHGRAASVANRNKSVTIQVV